MTLKETGWHCIHEMKITKLIYVKNRNGWREWLGKNHDIEKDVWLIYYKKHSGKERIPYNDAVEEALCFGWIDSTVKAIDGEKYAQRFSPRNSKSVMSEMNKERARRLIKQGKMTKFGLERIKHHHESINSKFEIPGKILKELRKDKDIWRNFQKFPKSYKRIRIGWIAMTKNPATYKQRLKYFLKKTKENKKFGMIQ